LTNRYTVAVAVAWAIISLAGALQARDRGAGYAGHQAAQAVPVASLASALAGRAVYEQARASRRQVVLVFGDGADGTGGPGTVVIPVALYQGFDRSQAIRSAPGSHGLKSLVSFRF